MYGSDIKKTFRLDSELLEKLKEAAKREHRSLNNYVECLLIVCIISRMRKRGKLLLKHVLERVQEHWTCPVLNLL